MAEKPKAPRKQGEGEGIEGLIANNPAMWMQGPFTLSVQTVLLSLAKQLVGRFPHAHEVSSQRPLQWGIPSIYWQQAHPNKPFHAWKALTLLISGANKSHEERTHLSRNTSMLPPKLKWYFADIKHHSALPAIIDELLQGSCGLKDSAQEIMAIAIWYRFIK